jgi:two-component system cell cycle sensor histidine kinase/response regulator CckA
LEANAKSGPYIMFAVRDTGVGMDEETMARIFEPFFSTKGIGKGTGLGLSVVYGIVKQHGGFINVQSQPECGTEFRIYLPVVSQRPAPVVEKTEVPIAMGSGTILLVEGESALRAKVREVLTKAGYNVVVGGDGQEAYRLSMSESRTPHLLLTDVVMPEMSGPRLAEWILNYRPEMKVLYMSGYPLTDDLPQVRANFISKPFTKAKLLRRVRETLDGSST